MSWSEIPCLSIAIAPLKTSTSAKHFAIWVLKAPSPGGYVHHDCSWPDALTHTWQGWQQLFSTQPLSSVWDLSAANDPNLLDPLSNAANSGLSSYSASLMQELGLQLWQWVFSGSIQNSFAQSIGIAIGQNQPLRLRLEIRDPELIALPWEIMQPRPGKPTISLNPQLRFSRTTSDVDPLAPRRTSQSLNILLVLGQEAETPAATGAECLQLEQEALALAQLLEESAQSCESSDNLVPVHCQVKTLVQPSPAETIAELENGTYNIFFYAGHGVCAPAGGQLLLQNGTTLSGTELAQVLVRTQVTLAVFNACWGAQSDRQNGRAIERSSLAEVLIHHGVPAVLGMRDSITDEEAISFIKGFARSLAERMPIDRAVAIARQQLLTIYKFNQPAWTLPVLYMHPEFDGVLIQPLDSLITELPENTISGMRSAFTVACLRLLHNTQKVWRLRNGMMRVGRRSENDLVIPERWVSQKHAEIFCRDISGTRADPVYFLRDFSRYGTLIKRSNGWQKVHHQEVQLESGSLLKFGSSQGQTLEFVVESLNLDP
jgi:hypothetical protein